MFVLTVIIFVIRPAQAENLIKGGFVDFNIYPHQSKVDSDNSLTINAFLSLANRFSYFSLTNFRDEDGDEWYPTLSAFFSEQNLRWQISEGSAFQITAQSNFRQGANNDRHRFGIRWHLNKTRFFNHAFNKVHLDYSVNWHAIQFDHEDPYVWQIEHVFKLKFPYLSERLYVSGFIDHTFNQDLPTDFPSNPIVAEVQLGIRLIDKMYFVSEYRVNEYRRSEVNNIATGIEYKMSW